MKIKVNINDSTTKKSLEDILTTAGLEISDEANLTIIEENPILEILIGKKEDRIYKIKTDDIILIESYGNNIYCETIDGEYLLKEKLKYLEFMLDEKKFIRINKSLIINRDKIKSMSSMIGMKFKIVLINKRAVYVNRTLYYKFKDFIGI